MTQVCWRKKRINSSLDVEGAKVFFLKRSRFFVPTAFFVSPQVVGADDVASVLEGGSSLLYGHLGRMFWELKLPQIAKTDEQLTTPRKPWKLAYDVLSFARQAFSSFHTSILVFLGILSLTQGETHMGANCFSVTCLAFGFWGELLPEGVARLAEAFFEEMAKMDVKKGISDIYWQWLSLFLCFCTRFAWLFVYIHFVCHFFGCLFTFCLPLFENKSRMRQWQAEIHSYRRDEQYIKVFSLWELIE